MGGTWAPQRQEGAIAAWMGHDDVTHPEVRQAIAKETGEVPVPLRYGSGDFLRTSYWSRRRKLDVSSGGSCPTPGASRDGDGNLLLG